MIGTSKIKPGRRRIKIRRSRNRTSVLWQQRFWDFQHRLVPQKALLGFLAGMLLGGLVGAVLSYQHSISRDTQSSILSVDQRTGEARLHVRGQPQLPELPAR